MKFIWKFLIAIFIYIICLFLYKSNKFEKLEFLLYDWRLKKSTLKEDLPIVVIGITEDFEREIGEVFSRKHYSEILKILKEENPEIVIFDIFFPVFTGNKEDIEFCESIKDNKKVILPVFSPIKLSKREGEIYIVQSIRGSASEFEKSALSVGHINTFPDRDQVVRKFPAFIKYENRIYLQIGLEASRIINKNSFNLYIPPLDKDGCFYVRFISPEIMKNYFISFSDVLKKKYKDTFFDKKIVIIGQTIVGAKNADLIPTPLGTQFGVFVQASAIGTIMSKKYIKHVPVFLYLFIYALFLSSIFWQSKILLNTSYTFGFSGLILYFSLIFMKRYGIFFDVVPFIFFSIFYYFSFIIYSLFLTIKKLFQKEIILNVVKETEKEFAEILNPIEAFRKEEILFLGFGSDSLIEKTPSIVLKTILISSGIEDGCFISVSNKRIEFLAKCGEKFENLNIEELIKDIESPKIINRFNGPSEIKNMAIIPVLLFPDFKVYGIFINKKPTAFSKTSKFTVEDINLIETLSVQGIVAIQNSKLNLILRNTQLETIIRLAMAIEYRDRETGGHIQRVSDYAYLIAKNLGFKENECLLIKNAMPLHDLGKIGIPDYILLKPEKLTEEERKIVEKHPIIGAKMLEGSNSIVLKAAEIIALYHHEKYDGTGYPLKLSGNEIPIYGRIATLSDVFDALTSKRIYKKEVSLSEAFEIINEEKGKTFDPKLVDIFLKLKDEVKKISEKYKEEKLWEI
ncbi:MAG: CHASE2 domain-containing protein [Candidatus Omnitrophica bacterium]|nr:CHASE2 domain-containing protein [Candidatus Omnitrophota bacterium]MCM8807348.1 CHASE2 domain-containing protein [Candidatus Omnitrophota bacterium]